MNKKKEKAERKLEAFDEITNEADALYGLSTWFGAIVVYLFKFGKIPFKDVFSKDNESRNTAIGYSFQIMIVGVVIVLMVLFIT